MIATACDVIEGRSTWSAEASDNLPWLLALPNACLAITFTSPPYLAARTYGIGIKLTDAKWVDFMVPRIVEMCRTTAGLVCVNMAPTVKDGSCSPCVEWLVTELTRNHGIVLGPAPYVFFRFGIPGSGGTRYHRRDWEPVYAFARPDRLPLVWTDNKATGHAPKWAPGGEMAHRQTDGRRVNHHGARRDGARIGNRRGEDCHRAAAEMPAHAADYVEAPPDAMPLLELTSESPPAEQNDVHPLLAGGGRGKGIGRDSDGSPVKRLSRKRKSITREREGMHTQTQGYDAPAVANSGNVIRESYDAETVRQLLDDLVTQKIEPGDVIRCLVGGGQMGSKLAHASEAPFPETLVEFFVRSYCPPGGVVCDPFMGSGTAGAVAVREGRRFVGCDLRQGQVDVARVRIGRETPSLFGGAAS